MGALDQHEPERIRFGYQRPLALVTAAVGVLALFALVALATSAESSEEYRERQRAEAFDAGDTPESAQSDPPDFDSEPLDLSETSSGASGDNNSTDQTTALTQDEDSTYYFSDDSFDVDGLRITPDGKLLAVEPGEMTLSDFPLSETGNGGISMTNPSSQDVIELASTDGRVTGRSTSPGSGFAPLPRTTEGSVIVVPSGDFTPEQLAGAGGEPVLLDPPQGPISMRFTEEGLVAEPLPEDAVIIDDFIDEVFAPSDSLPWRRVLFAYVALAVASLIGAFIMWSRRPRQDLNLKPFGAEPTQIDHFERVIQSIAQDPDPTNAILFAFSVAERGIGHLAARRVEETPFEWHNRLLASKSSTQTPELGRRLGPVCDLYARARFAPGNASESDRQAMIAALRDLHAVASNQFNSPGPRPDLGVAVGVES